MLVVCLRPLGVAELSVLSLQRSPCLRSWIVISSHMFINKEISSSNIVYCALLYIVIYELYYYAYDISLTIDII